MIKASLSHCSTHTAQWEWLDSRSKDRMGFKGEKIGMGHQQAASPSPAVLPGGSISENRLLCRLKVKINELLSPELHKNSKMAFGNAERPIRLLPS